MKTNSPSTNEDGTPEAFGTRTARAFFADSDLNVRFFFSQLPEYFRFRHERASKAVSEAVRVCVGKFDSARDFLEKDFPATLSKNLISFEYALRGCLTGHATLGEENVAKLAETICEKLLETNRETVSSDFWYRCLAEAAETVESLVLGRVREGEAKFSDSVYRSLADRLAKDYAEARAALSPPYSVTLQDGEIVRRPEVHDRDGAVYLGDAEAVWTGVDDDSGSFAPPAGLSIPVALSQSFSRLGCLIYKPSENPELKKNVSAILSNIVFHRLLSGLPDVKISIFDPGLSLVSDYEHDLTHDLPADPEARDAVIERFQSFDDFSRLVGNLVDRQPENYEKTLQENASSRRLRRLYSVLVLPESLDDETAVRSFVEWIDWYVRQFPRGIGLYVVASEPAFAALSAASETLSGAESSLLRLDDKGDPVVSGEKTPWKFGTATFLPSWADSDWKMGREVLRKLIQTPKPDAPGTVSVFFANEENGEPYRFRFTSQKANTIFMSGAQGTGKTLALQFFIFRAAEAHSPDELQFYLFDYKNTLGYLRNLCHVAFLTTSTSEQITLGVLRDINEVMRGRQKTFRSVEEKYKRPCQNLDEYNAIRTSRPNDRELKAIPRILVVVDECKNMLEAKSREISSILCNELLTKCRSAGVHFLFATTEDIRSSVAKDKFDFTIRLLDPVNGKRKARLISRDEEYNGDGRMLAMPVISDAEKASLLTRVGEVNSVYSSSRNAESALMFDQSPGEALPAEKYNPFVREFKRAVESAERAIRICTGVDTRQLRQLHSVPFALGKARQVLSVFGDFSSSAFRGGVGLMLLSLAAAARRGVRVSVVDPDSMLAEKASLTDPMRAILEESGLSILVDRDACFEAKKSWIQTASGKDPDDSPRFLVVVDAEDNLQGEEDRVSIIETNTLNPELVVDEIGETGKHPTLNVPHSESSENVSDPLTELLSGLASIDADALEDLKSTETRTMVPADEPGTAAETDRLLSDAKYISKASLRSAFLVLLSSKPRRLSSVFDGYTNDVQDIGRFLVFQTAQQFPGLDNAPKEGESMASSLGYYAETPGDDMPKEHFIPLSLDSMDAAALRSLLDLKH